MVIKNDKGITLVSLVVTIILIIILSGVSINLILGENGIITKAKKAVEDYETARRDEEQEIKYLEELITVSDNTWNGKVATSFASGQGTKENPYIIENGGELVYFANLLNSGNEEIKKSHIEITKSIDLNNIKITPIGIGKSGELAGGQWDFPIEFNGNLNGNGCIITGINIDEPDMSGVGLIGVLGETGIVENLNIYNGTIKGKNYVGGIVGVNSGKITNCTNKATIVAQDNLTEANSGNMAGGIVGWHEKGLIENCINYGNISTKNNSFIEGRGTMAGGIVGSASSHYNTGSLNAEIRNCKNKGEINAGAQIAGGIVGYIAYTYRECSIENCINNGKVEGKFYVGGIVGNHQTGSVIKSVNNGTVVAKTYYAAGIVGYQKGDETKDTVIVSNCSNTGEIKAIQNVGGIAGRFIGNVEISSCDNSGTIKSDTDQVGGISGSQEAGIINKVSNTGTIIAGMDSTASKRRTAGGIIGTQWSGTLTEAYNSGNVKINSSTTDKIDTIGGIIGYQYVEGNGSTVSKVYNKGTLQTSDAVGAIIGHKVPTGIVEKSYYYTQGSEKGIGSETTSTTEVVVVSDVVGKTEKVTDDIQNYNIFLTWIEKK